MRILFDLISQQDSVINGGSLYGLRVFSELCERGADVSGFYDSRLKLNRHAAEVCGKYSVKLFDIAKEKLGTICERVKADRLFISIAQRFRKIDLRNIDCEIIIVCHDVVNMILSQTGLYSFKTLIKDFGKLTKRVFDLKGIFLRFFAARYDYRRYYKFFQELIKRSNVHVITVSEYSKASLEYYFSGFFNRIEVYAPPQKLYEFKEEISEPKIKELLESGKKYILLVSCDRFNKNARIFLKQFGKLGDVLGGRYCAVIVGRIKTAVKNTVVLESAGGSDLEHLYKNAELFVYPSLGEGFGSPPVEAMRYGTPVIASFCTAIPEVLGEHAVYFNPLYPEDLFGKILYALERKEELRESAAAGFRKISERQEAGLRGLLGRICEHINEEKTNAS